MTTYRVIWEIDLDADSPEAAAKHALAIQRDPESIATVFRVQESFGPQLSRTFTIDALSGRPGLSYWDEKGAS